MEDDTEDCTTIFSQDGVMFKQGRSYYIHYLNMVGSLCINEYHNSEKTRFFEWRPSIDVRIDSTESSEECEWAVVNTFERSNSKQQPADARTKCIKLDMKDLASFKVSKKMDRLTFSDGKGEAICSFSFQSGNCSSVVGALKGLLRTYTSRRDKNIFIIAPAEMNEANQLNRSFAELNLFQESGGGSDYYLWNFVKNLQQMPYQTTMQTFSKIADIVIAAPEVGRHLDEATQRELHESISALESTTTVRSQDEYEVVAHMSKLPERKDYPRGTPITLEQWKQLLDHEEKIEDIDYTKLHIFRGGVMPCLRTELWKYLLDYYPWDSTNAQRQALAKSKREEYYIMKLQWRSMTKAQEENFSDYRERKSLIEKDVNRTDRNLEFYAGDNNGNLQTLFEILMTYVMCNFDLGYVQGMSDLLSPILFLLKDEVESFWCFVGFMNKISSNFDEDQAGMKDQLQNLHTLVAFVNPYLANYLDQHDSGNMFFCFRWLLVWFKRELSQEDVMRLWEVLWTGLPCKNFHLLISVAILDAEKDSLVKNGYGFTEILKHINELSGCLHIDSILNRAEGIYNQMISSEHLTDAVRVILGIPMVTCSNSPIDSTSSVEPTSLETVTLGDAEAAYEKAISNSFL